MPTKKGVSYSQALAEFAAIASVQAPALSTFELWHPAMAQPIYVVNDNEDFVATKEASAARDAGVEVTFVAASIEREVAEESDDAPAPEIGLTVANVSGLLQEFLRGVRGRLDFMTITERVYMADDPSGPAILPVLELIVVSVDMTEDVMTLRARFADPVNVSVPVLTFRRAEYPGLVR